MGDPRSFPADPEGWQKLLDEKDVGDRIGRVAERAGERLGKRVGQGVGGVITFTLGTINDIIELPRDLMKK